LPLAVLSLPVQASPPVVLVSLAERWQAPRAVAVLF
jgi:hypothetical protein